MKICRKCSRKFEIGERDLFFLDKFTPIIGGQKFAFQGPTLCPDCRAFRRLRFRNENHFYKRKCDFSGKNVVSVFSADKPFPVYDQEIWWSDKWDGLNFGRDFDFEKSFFSQFAELSRVVPKISIINRNSQNSEYTNLCERNKNCYLLTESSNNEDCLYGYWMQLSRDSMNCSFCQECELLFECDNCSGCYNLDFSKNCVNCRDSFYLDDCIGCSDCFCCMNLRQKRFFIFNKEYRENDYRQKVAELKQKSPDEIMEMFQDYFKNEPRRHAFIIQSEDISGDYISQSRDCHFCFHAQNAEHCRYAVHVWRNSKFVMDCDTVGMDSELCYECINTAIQSYGNCFCNQCWTVSNSLYCSECHNSSNLFGCVGLKHKKYCILNKQYSKAEYEGILPRIIEHMRLNAEWGEFFPEELSPFTFEESAASGH